MNAIYCRVSTDMQAETGYSISDQIRTCHAHASKLGLKTSKNSEYVDDGYSGEYLERPALDRLRDDVRVKLIQNIIIYDPDRLSRNLTNQLLLADEIEKAGVHLHFVTGSYDASPEGRLFFSIRGAISAFEKAKIRERTLRGKRAKASSGKMIQKTQAYGYDWDEENSTYIINDQEADIVKTIYDLYLSRSVSIKDIALLFRQQNIRTRKDNPITISLIYRILTDEKYAGTKWSFKRYDKKISQYKRQTLTREQDDWIPIPVSPIISLEQFYAARNLLSENKRKSPRNTKHEYLLRSFLKCGVCGYALSAHHKQHPSGREYNWYKCNSGGTDKALTPCGNPAISSVQLDKIVWDYLCRIAKNSKDMLSLSKHHELVDNTAQMTKLKNYQNDLLNKQATILHWFKNSMLAPDKAEKELNNIKKELEITVLGIANLSLETKKTTTITLEEILAKKSFSERRTVIEKVGWKVYIDNRKKPTKISFRM
jgi:site-specific DNA recombinase